MIMIFLVLFGIFWLQYIHIMNWGFDDSFFGYTYAKNLASGNGFTFNGEKVLGTSAPFPVLVYALISYLLKFFKFEGEIHILAGYISIIAIILTTVMTYLLLQKIFKNILASIVGALFFYFNLFYLMMFGHESILAILLFIFSVYSFYLNKIRLSFLLLSFAVLTRNEIILFFPLFLFEFYQIKGKVNWTKTLVSFATFFVLPIAVWYSFSYIYFGQFFSNTIGVKIMQAELTQRFNEGIVWWFRDVLRYQNKVGGWMAFFLLTLGFIASIRLFRFFLINILFLLAPFLFYELIGIAFYHWFLFPFALGLSFNVGYATGCIYEIFNSRDCVNKALRWGVIILLCFLTFAYNGNIVRDHGNAQVSEQPYKQIGLYLRDNVDKNSTVAYYETGQIGYFSQLRIVDVMGMTTKNVLKEYKLGNRLYAYTEYKPDYIIIRTDFTWWNDPTKEEWFKMNYQQIKVLDFYAGQNLNLYKRIGNFE